MIGGLLQPHGGFARYASGRVRRIDCRGDRVVKAEFPGRHRRLAVRFSVVALFVAINIASLPLVDRGMAFLRAPKENSRVSKMADTPNLLRLSQQLNNVESTHNLFMELNVVAEGTEIDVLSGTERFERFDVGRRFRARLAGLVRPSSIVIHDDVESGIKEAVLDAVASSDYQLREGTIWERPDQAREGKPGYAWRIYLATDHAERLVMVVTDDEHHPIWHIVDSSLLPARLQGQIRQW